MLTSVYSLVRTVISNCLPIRKLISAISIISATLLLNGCPAEGMLAPGGQITATELKLLIFAIALMLLVVVPVIFLSFWFAWRYRASANAPYKPEWSHSTKLEIIWWGIPCLIILVLGTVTWFTTHSLDPFKPLPSTKKPIIIQTIALDWKWLFIYPDYGIATINYIEIPVDRPINFKVSSAAPMNSFFIPQLAGQIYAMAGMETQLHLIANKPGKYRGFSANYTGAGFAEMQFYAKATTYANFMKWIRTVQRSPKHLTWQTFWNQWAKQSIDVPPTYFGRVDARLFDHVINHYKIPHYQPGKTKLSQLSDHHSTHTKVGT